MGRKRTHDHHLPSRVYRRSGTYYYVSADGCWIRLGRTEAELYRRLADILDAPPAAGMATLLDRYAAEVLPTKAAKTQHEQRAYLALLRRVFGQMEPGAILPRNIARYLDERGKVAPVAANREISLLSHVFRKAIRWGIAAINPCTGVERNHETPRDRYVTDAEFAAVYQRAPAHLQILMDLAYLTGQRQQDLLGLRLADLIDDGILFQQRKTGARLCVVWSDALRAVVDRARTRHAVASVWLVATPHGQRYTSGAVQAAWYRLIAECVAAGVVGERFTFHDLRAKARSDGDDKGLLGHADPAKMARTYQRTPVRVKPVK